MLSLPSTSSAQFFYLCIFHRQTNLSLQYLPLDLVSFPHPCSLPLLQKSEILSSCHLKKQCSAHPPNGLLRKPYPRAGSLNWVPGSHHVRINWGLSLGASKDSQHPGLCPSLTQDHRFPSDAEADGSMKVIWQEEQEGDRSLFSQNEYAHHIWNCTMENKYVFIYTVGNICRKLWRW